MDSGCLYSLNTLTSSYSEHHSCDRIDVLMPGTTLPPVTHYVPASPTKEDRKHFDAHHDPVQHFVDRSTSVDWADLVVVDISKARTPQGRAALAPQIRDAMRTSGFIYVINHGMTQSQVRSCLMHVCSSHQISAQTDRIFDIGDIAFSQVSEEEKRERVAKIAEDGSKIGYKMRQLWVSGFIQSIDLGCASGSNADIVATHPDH